MIYDIITVRRANTDYKQFKGNVGYLYNNQIWIYSLIKNVEYKNRWRIMVHNAENWKEKIKEDLSLGFKVINID